MTRFQKLAIATTTVTFLLIGLGGFVRAAGAGLGCPDWPRCFGRWIPPTEASQLPADIDPELFNFQLAWIEYVNRLVGVTVGLLILATAWLAWRDHRGDRPVLVPALAAVPLVAFQGWFGGQVVAHELDPRFVSVHLLVAVAIIAVLIAAAANSFPKPGGDETADPTPQLRLVRAGLVLVLLQICLGALVSAGASTWRPSVSPTWTGAPCSPRPAGSTAPTAPSVLRYWPAAPPLPLQRPGPPAASLSGGGSARPPWRSARCSSRPGQGWPGSPSPRPCRSSTSFSPVSCSAACSCSPSA